MTTFADLGLAEPILRALLERGYTTPTPIQMQAIPAVMGGGDLLAGAQTGTGKTAGFTLPILQRLISTEAKPHANGKAPIRVLVLTPTRELAAQVQESIADYGKYLPFNTMVMFGGVSINPQISQLRRRVDILVATPGRLLDHVSQRTVDLSKVEILVLDEADRMLDMGFLPDIKRVLALLPKARQNLLFSATFSNEIKTLADSLLNQPALIEVARRNATAELITQQIYRVDRERKRELLAHLISKNDWKQVLIFTRTKHGANRLAEYLEKNNISALAIHGNKSQGARTRALSEFKSGSLTALVATDIAARGIDISELPHVVNYELPNVAEDYVHRIGRTGRAGTMGEAISLVCKDENDFLKGIERLIKIDIPSSIVAGFELDPNEKPEPIVLGRANTGRGGRPRGGGGGGGRGQPGGGRSGSGAAGSGRSGASAGAGAGKPRSAAATPRAAGAPAGNRGPQPRGNTGGGGGRRGSGGGSSGGGFGRG